MSTKLRKWLPIALCCLPGIAVAAVVVLGLAFSSTAFGTSLDEPLGLALIALAVLACPLSMGLITWRRVRQNKTFSNTLIGRDNHGT